MGLLHRQRDAFNQGLNRHHVLAAAVALIVSLILHVTALTGIKTIPLLPSVSRPDIKRFATVEMRDVELNPPPKMETVERESLDSPSAAAPPDDIPDDVWTELKAAEPLLLPLPEPPAQPVDPGPAPAEDFPVAVRQEILAIPDALFADEEIALPRRWVPEDIPRIDQAPDIQLPVELTDLALKTGDAFVQAGVAFSEDMSAGTPDWTSIMGRRASIRDAGPAVLPAEQVPQGSDMLEERPEDVSSLQPIEDLLQVRVAGYRVDDRNDDLYFALHIERASERVLPIQPRDVLFIQDSSASMTPVKMDECRRGLKRWLDFMNPGDRFEVMSFRDDILPCFNEWRYYDDASRGEAMRYIDGMRAVGNTDLFQSIQSALHIEQDPARTLLLILITDARPTVGVTDSSAIIERITQFNQGRISMFAVGGGAKVNSFFLDLISYRNRGEAVITRADEEIPLAMEKWAKQLRRPVLTDLSFSFSKVNAADVYPKQLTHLFLDRPLVIYGRLPAGVDSFAFQVVGRAGTTWHDMLFVIDRSQIALANENIRNHWAWQKIYHMIGDYLGDSTEARLEAIRTFADEYGLIVPYGFSRALPRR